MGSTVDLRDSALTLAPALKRAGKYFAYIFALLVALTVYCEICDLVSDYPPRGFFASVAWALQVASGWVLIGAALGMFGERVLNHPFVQQHPRKSLVCATLALGTFALFCDVTIGLVTQAERNVFALVYERAPLTFAGSALLIAAFLGNRLLKRAARRKDAHQITEVERAQRLEPLPLRQVTTEDDCTLDVMTGTGHTSIRIADIECLEADRNYINVVHMSGRTYLLRQTMAAVERSLNPAQFVRIHRSTIVNVRGIKERRNGCVLVLHSGRSVKISRAFRERALARLHYV